MKSPKILLLKRKDFLFLKRLALIGCDWEYGNAIGVKQPEAQAHAKLTVRWEKRINNIESI